MIEFTESVEIMEMDSPGIGDEDWLMKIVLAFDLGEEFVRDLRATFPDVDFRPAYNLEDEVKGVVDAEVQFGLISQGAFQEANCLRWFHYIGMGFDNILKEVPEIVESDILFTNTLGTHVIPMADHTFAMILAFAHHIPELIADQKAHRWDTQNYMDVMIELAGTTMGVVALGDVGKAIAQRARGFDMDVYAVDIHPMSPPPGVREVWGMERLDELLSLSDWLVVTAPYTAESRNMIDRRCIERIKPGAHIIVISRGGIVDEEALVDALRSGYIAGAGLDVLAQEPPPSDSPLWDVPNVLLSPHVSAHSPQLWVRRGQIFKDNLRRYLAGEPLLNVCDLKAGF